MKISELVQTLITLKEMYGDVDVKVQTLSHVWPPEPQIRDPKRKDRYVILNP